MANQISMEHRVEAVGVSTFATITGWIGGQAVAVFLAIPAELAQIASGITVAVLSTVAVHFTKRWLNHRWADKPEKAETKTE